MSTGMTIRALVFDVFGTVVDWHSGITREATRLLGPAVDASGLATAWRGQYFPAMDRVRRGELPWTDLDALHRDALDELLPAFGAADADEATRAELVLGWHRLDPWPDSVAGLIRLKALHPIITLSNGNVSLLLDMARHGGLPWDAVFSAELFGHYKPDAEVYDGAARLLKLAPDEVLMVAAHTHDLAAARRRGLRTAYVFRPLEAGPSGPTPPATDPDADLTVASLTELAEAIER